MRGDIDDFTNSGDADDSGGARSAWAAGDISTAIVQHQRREVPVGKHAVMAGNPDDDRTRRNLERSRETIASIDRQLAEWRNDPDREERSRRAQEYIDDYNARNPAPAPRQILHRVNENALQAPAPRQPEAKTKKRNIDPILDLATAVGETTGGMERRVRELEQQLAELKNR